MGIFDRLLGRRAGPADFWRWFATNVSRFEGVPDAGLVNELAAHLPRVHPQLVFQIGKREIEISADGIRDMIPVVREVVAAAPAIAGWTVHAFRQPQPGISVEIGGRRYSAEDVYFEARGTHVDLFLAGYDEAREAVTQIAFVLLDAAIGELAAMTKIATLDMHELGRRGSGTRPLSELRAALEASN